MSSKTIMQGFGAAIAILLLRVWPLISPHHSLIYHSILPVNSLIWGMLISLGTLTLLAALLFGYLKKSDTPLNTFIWALVAAGLAPALVGNIAAWRQKGLAYLYVEVLFYGTLLAALALRWRLPSAYQHAVRGMLVLLLLVGCGMAWVVPELLYLALRTQPRDAQMPVTRARSSNVRETTPGDRGRIVWLLFDELSYEQAFDHRFSGLEMPAFDRIRSESVSFSDLKPAGSDTERALPSFFLGHVVDAIRSNLNGDLLVKLDGQKDWQAFDAQATLFSDAQRLGWTAGLVGWYNPYCRILGETLNYCFWRMGNGQWNGTSRDQSVLKNATAPFMEMVGSWQSKPGSPQEEKHAADLAAVVSQAKALIRDQSIGFVFIHLPVPHPPGIYDRRTGHERASGTYIDNLALADEVLEELIGTLQTTASAAKTTVIVCSDHSWRVALWRPTPQWSHEEEIASHGHFDPRPVLMIHFPGQTTEHDITQPFDEIRIHDIVARMLRGQKPDFDKSLPAVGTALAVAPKP
jgi:Sulfatase